jgi:lipopolysaccharide export system protein LptA
VKVIYKQRLYAFFVAAAAFLAAGVGAQTGEAGVPTEESSGEAGKAETGADKKKEDEYHVEADVTEGYYSAGDQVLHGIGNVVIVHGNTTITCDEAFSYEKRNLATLLGNVIVKDEVQEYTLTAGYVEYFREKRLSIATKSPRLVLERDQPITITSDLMRMWTEKDYGEAVGDVKVVSEDVEGYGQKLKYFGKKDRIDLEGDPVVRQEDSRLAGDEIILFLKDNKLRRARAEGSSRLLYFSRPTGEPEEEAEAAEEEGGAEGGAPLSAEEAEKAGPEETASAPEDEGAATGEELAIIDPGEQPPEGSETGGAAEGEEEEPPTGRVEAAGDLMEGFFTDGKLERVDITGDAEGHYWPFDEFGRETGEQIDSAGDLIRVTMNEGELKKILVEGNAEGVYRPARAEGRSGVTRTTGDRISVFVTENEVRRIVVFGHARGSYFTEEETSAKEREAAGG